MKTFRSILFWTHLAASLVAGVIIFVMSFTGTILAFEDELVAWAERDARGVKVPADANRLTLDELTAAFVATHPHQTPSSITVSADPATAVTLTLGRNTTYYLNPYTAEIRQLASTGMADFMHSMVAWHRWLGRDGDSRAVGKTITGASNTAFVVLAITGLYLWWPRSWRLNAAKRSLWFVRAASGKARDWNWHNVIGFWLLVPITIMTLTGMVISYSWASNLIYRAVGEEPPARRGPPDAAPPAGHGESGGHTNRKPSARVVSLESLYAAVAAAEPNFSFIKLKLPVVANNAVTVKVPGTWPRTATTTLHVANGEVTEKSDFSDLSTGRQLRTWSRFLHTGQALGWGGQFIAGLGCLGGCFLVYTGFALSWRRFFSGKKTVDASSRS